MTTTPPSDTSAPRNSQDGADLDQHGRGAGVELVLGGVERDVVDREPGHAAAKEQLPLAPGGRDPARAKLQGAEQDHADREPAQGQGARADVGADRADRDERRRPRHHRDGHGDGGEGALARGDAGLCLLDHAQTLAGRHFDVPPRSLLSNSRRAIPGSRAAVYSSR
jgi:hypothetical protein